MRRGCVRRSGRSSHTSDGEPWVQHAARHPVKTSPERKQPCRSGPICCAVPSSAPPSSYRLISPATRPAASCSPPHRAPQASFSVQLNPSPAPPPQSASGSAPSPSPYHHAPCIPCLQPIHSPSLPEFPTPPAPILPHLSCMDSSPALLSSQNTPVPPSSHLPSLAGPPRWTPHL